MRRKTSDRNKSKSTPEKSPEKSSRKSHRHSRRRRKSSSSSSEDEKPLKKSSGDIRVSEPKVVDQKRESNKETAEAVVKPDIESDLSAGSSKKSIKKTVLPNETTEIKSVLVPEETPSKEEKPPEWKEDSEFWNASTEVKVGHYDFVINLIVVLSLVGFIKKNHSFFLETPTSWVLFCFFGIHQGFLVPYVSLKNI